MNYSAILMTAGLTLSIAIPATGMAAEAIPGESRLTSLL